MRRVDLEQQPIVHHQFGRLQTTVGAEAQHGVVAVDVLIDEKPREPRRAGVTITAAQSLERQMAEGIVGDAAACRLQFAQVMAPSRLVSRPSTKSRSRSAMSHWPSSTPPDAGTVR